MPRKRKPPTARHATRLQVAQRVDELLRISLGGAQLWDIREYVREKVAAKDPVWGEKPLSDSQLYRYLALADSQISESYRGSRGKLIRKPVAMRRYLYAKADSAGDNRTALAVADSEAKLLGLFPRPEDELRRVQRDVEELKKALATTEP